MNIHVPLTPLELLLPYQSEWVNDAARFKFGLMARQVGKDFSSGAEGIRDCYLAEESGNKINWLLAAPSERQSLESLEKWKEWAEAFKFAIDNIEEERENPRDSQSLLKSSTITFPGGSRVIAVPGRPDTVRGFSAHILLTEALFFEDFDKTWRAILPSITNPLRGGPKKCRLISTPNGVGNKGHELWTKNYRQPNSRWSCHFVDIYRAVKEGLPIDIEELREALDDPEGWAQEYELQFLDQATVLLPYEIIAACENPLATESVPDSFWAAEAKSGEPIVLGIDFGRKRDLTVCWADAILGGAFQMTKEVFCMKALPTDVQVEHLRPRIRRAQRVCLDYTGPGIGLGDYLVKEFGEFNPEKHLYGKIELCTFTNPLKVDIFSKLRMNFDRRLSGIPVSRVIREDLHSVSRVALAGGGITYRATHTDAGHADRCTAKALANRAASNGGGPFRYQKIALPNRSLQPVRSRRRFGKGVWA